MSDCKITRNDTPAGAGATYTVEMDVDAEAVIWRAAKFHECSLEAILGTALNVYLEAFDESVRLAMEARDGGPPGGVTH